LLFASRIVLRARGRARRGLISKLLLDPTRAKGRQELFHLGDEHFLKSTLRPRSPSRQRARRLLTPAAASPSRWVTGWLLLGAAACVVASCARSRPADHNDARMIKDEIGRSVSVPANPSRIVSLAPSVTETLYALGVGDKVVGVTSFCDYPPEAALKERVGDTMRPSIEKIVLLKPDLAIVSTASQLESFVRKLDNLGIPVYVSSPRNFDGVLDSIARIGELAGAGDRAREITGVLRDRVDRVRARTERLTRPRVLIVLGTSPLITAGGGTFVDDLITRAGGESISADLQTEYPQFSIETAVARRPEVIFMQAGESQLPDRLRLTPAARSGRVFRVNDDLLLRPGPRIVDGLEQMALKIHPEAFDQDKAR